MTFPKNTMGKITNVPNHQPVKHLSVFIDSLIHWFIAPSLISSCKTWQKYTCLICSRWKLTYAPTKPRLHPAEFAFSRGKSRRKICCPLMIFPMDMGISHCHVALGQNGAKKTSNLGNSFGIDTSRHPQISPNLMVHHQISHDFLEFFWRLHHFVDLDHRARGSADRSVLAEGFAESWAISWVPLKTHWEN